MTEAEAEAIEKILNDHYDDECDEHAYTTSASMREALVKAFNLGRSSLPQRGGENNGKA